MEAKKTLVLEAAGGRHGDDGPRFAVLDLDRGLLRRISRLRSLCRTYGIRECHDEIENVLWDGEHDDDLTGTVLVVTQDFFWLDTYTVGTGERLTTVSVELPELFSAARCDEGVIFFGTHPHILRRQFVEAAKNEHERNEHEISL